MKNVKQMVSFVAVAAIALIGFVPALAGSLEPPPGPVSPTRPQDTCFDNTGNRFVDCGDGTIKDTQTGLFWLKDANCFGTLTWADANKVAADLAHGQCGLADGSLPGDWRLPTLACPSAGTCPYSTPPTGEFAAIHAPACPSPSILDTAGTGCWSEGNPFNGVQTFRYWSATTVAGSPSTAWITAPGTGSVSPLNKSGPYYVWAVRDGN